MSDRALGRPAKWGALLRREPPYIDASLCVLDWGEREKAHPRRSTLVERHQSSVPAKAKFQRSARRVGPLAGEMVRWSPNTPPGKNCATHIPAAAARFMEPSFRVYEGAPTH